MSDATIAAALNAVLDPCSVAAARPLGLIDMGLVLGWQREAATLIVTLCTTSGECAMAPHFLEAARAALLALPGVERVEMKIDHDFVWTPDRMARPSRLLAGLTPFAGRVA